MPHPFAAHLGLSHFHAAAVADDALVFDPLVLAAVALPIFRRAEDFLAEQAFLLRLERPVVDRFRLFHFAVRPGTDDLGRGDADGDGVENVDVVGRRVWVFLLCVVITQSPIFPSLFPCDLLSLKVSFRGRRRLGISFPE